ncbi:MAG: alpha/beta hydrolase-fold protein [Buchananella hordeovulneris]|nr:alpha/beta hydrolase-fold protein [Buchananella hordeovulneris]
MALARYDWYAPSLKLHTPVVVLDPSDVGGGESNTEHPLRLLYLFHGMSNNSSAWLRRSLVERYVEGRNIVVVMPDLGRSYGANEVGGLPYWDYLRYDMPLFARQLLRLNVAPQHTGVAGLSMGGYAAMRLALAAPESFAVAGSFSGTLHVAARWQELERGEHRRVFGADEPLEGTEVDLLARWRQLDDVQRLPHLYVSCGTADPLYRHNQDFVNVAQQAGVGDKLTAYYGPGAHDWEFWDAQLLAFLNWWDSQEAAPQP